MVKHVILWQIKDEYSGIQIAEIKKEVKAGLEGLKGKIPGLIDIKVITDGLGSSNADLMLDSSFENQQALEVYQKHPDHVAVASGKVRPFMKNRVVMDYEDK